MNPTKTENGKESKCNVCTKPALRLSSYGGLVCSTCRSFFRRSAQTKNYLKFTCKRVTECTIDPGTRFKKSTKANIPTCLRIPFSSLEEKTVKDLNFHLHVPWLKHLYMLDKYATVNLMDFVYIRLSFFQY